MNTTPNPTEAIAFKKHQQSRNRSRIADALVELQRQGRPVNVQAVARAAGVHPHTVRRNPDLLQEVVRLRSAQWQNLTVGPQPNKVELTLRAKLLEARSEIADLRDQLTQLRRDAHQALGASGGLPSERRSHERELAALRVELGTALQVNAQQAEVLQAQAVELVEARELARRYLREGATARTSSTPGR